MHEKKTTGRQIRSQQTGLSGFFLDTFLLAYITHYFMRRQITAHRHTRTHTNEHGTHTLSSVSEEPQC